MYNPDQKDTDKDGIGDLCDADLDGDGKSNQLLTLRLERSQPLAYSDFVIVILYIHLISFNSARKTIYGLTTLHFLQLHLSIFLCSILRTENIVS